jgi:GAF domain-containing protein
MTREELLARTFIELADTLVDDFDLIEVTQRLVERCVELFDVSAAGLLMAGADGELRMLASSNEALRVVELFEIQAEEGACFDCYHSGVAVVNEDLADTAGRWPAFSALAVDAGYYSVHALPVRLRRQVIGALNLFRGDRGQLNDADVSAAQGLADAVAIAILQERAVHDRQLILTQLEGALNSRILIEQAKGVFAERAKTSTAEAFTFLRSYARTHNQKLSEVCAGVINGSIFPATTVKTDAREAGRRPNH